MLLSILLQNYVLVPTSLDKEIKRITIDSRLIKAGDLFIAIPGVQSDGRQYIKEAITKGAAAVLMEASANSIFAPSHHTPIIFIQHLKKLISELAARFYDYPAEKLNIIGVTGTNGKTSCTHFIANILHALNVKCGIIGTEGWGFLGNLVSTGLTTPNIIQLQSVFSDLVSQQASTVAVEVSSHGIHQGRIEGLHFAASLFTNLTQDHLDYHGDMEAYANVKKYFLTHYPTQRLVINADDPYGFKWIQELCVSKPIYAYSLNKPSFPPSVKLIYVSKYEYSLEGIWARVVTPWGEGELNLPLIGAFNLSNILCALAATGSEEVGFLTLLDACAKVKPVPGRMQKLGGDKKPVVIIDYSHTPDCLEKALQSLRRLTKGRLICVFGCGGNRDTTKRPIMGKIAEDNADHVIVTNDNPRFEDPDLIAAQILQGMKQPAKASVLLDRSQAIEKSIEYANEEDCVLIAGKGAENYQQFGNNKLPFDDLQNAASCLKRWFARAF